MTSTWISDTRWDVVVIGGGTAGLFAGIAAARRGAKTLVIERGGHLGGNIATGMNLGGFFDGRDRRVIGGLPEELVRRVVAMEGGRGHIFFHDRDRWVASTASLDPEVFNHVAFEMLRESGCKLWLYATFVRGIGADGHVEAVEVVTKAGVCRLEASVFIDASGDADLAASVGVPFERGGGKRQQAVTCMFRVGNVNLAEVERYMEERVNTEKKTPWTFQNAPLRASHKYWTPWKMFPDYERRFAKQFGVYYHGTPGDVFINSTHTSINSLAPEDITEGTMRLRRQAMEQMAFLKAHVWGFEEAYLTHVYDLGVRESRRIRGDYTLTVDDMKSERAFDDTVAMGAYPPDLHDAKAGDILISGKGWSQEEDSPSAASNLPYNPGYQIPYRCLLASTHDNLLVAGRCLSATFEAQAGARGMGPCSAMGQAVGTAAALAAAEGTTPRRLDVTGLRAALLHDGACLGRAAKVEVGGELQVT
jgi:FAD dependent oxidoreductase